MGTRKNGRARRRHSLARAHSLFHPLLPSACYAGYNVVIGTKLWESPPSRRVARQLSRGWRGKRETTCSQIIKTTCIFMASCRLFWLVTQSSLRSAWWAPRNVRLRVVSLFFLVLRAKRPRHANDHTRDWRHETGEARQKRVSLFPSRPRFSTLAHACTPFTISEEKERLLAVYRNVCVRGYILYCKKFKCDSVTLWRRAFLGGKVAKRRVI